MPWQSTDLAAAAVTVGNLVALRAADRDIVVTRIADTHYAIEDRCSHAGCPFSEDGELDGTTVICNCHGSEFDVRTGAVVRPPASGPVASFPTRVVHGVVEIDL